MATWRLLVVDDEALLRLAMLRTLEQAGHVCDGAADGLEGIEHLHRRAYDLVITDLRMPRLDGIQMIRRARELGIAARFLLISGYRDELDAHASEPGVVRVVHKPVMPRELCRHVDELLEPARAWPSDEPGEG